MVDGPCGGKSICKRPCWLPMPSLRVASIVINAAFGSACIGLSMYNVLAHRSLWCVAHHTAITRRVAVFGPDRQLTAPQAYSGSLCPVADPVLCEHPRLVVAKSSSPLSGHQHSVSHPLGPLRIRHLLARWHQILVHSPPAQLLSPPVLSDVCTQSTHPYVRRTVRRMHTTGLRPRCTPRMARRTSAALCRGGRYWGIIVLGCCPVILMMIWGAWKGYEDFKERRESADHSRAAAAETDQGVGV